MALVGLLPALSLLAGAVLGTHVDLNPWVPASVLPAACFAAFAFWRRGSSLATAALALGLLAAGIAVGVDSRERALHTSARDRLNERFGGFLLDSLGPAGAHEPLACRAVLVEDASVREGFVSLRVDLVALWLNESWQPVDGGVTISVSGAVAPRRASEWRKGRTIEAPVTFRRPARYLNDGVPDFERDLALDGVTLLGTVKSGLLVTTVARGSRLSEAASEIRAHVRRAIGQWIDPHDPVSAAIAVAVLIGDRTGLEEETRQSLQAAGTYHVIAISGGNIAILATAATLVLFLLGIRGRRAAVVAIALLTVYALVINAGPSVWRATLMAVLFFGARAMDHRTAAWHTTAVAAAVMVVVRPLDVRDPGFVLTFGATVALLEGARAGTALIPRHRVLGWLVASCTASAAVEIALLPVSAVLFSRVTAAGLVLNLLAVPLMGVVQMTALVATMASRVPWIAGPSGWVAHAAARALIDSAELVTIAPWLTGRVPPPSLALVALYYAALATTLIGTHKGLRVSAVAILLGTMVALVAGIDPWRAGAADLPRNRLRLTMFDVGQGESMLLETPGGGRILIDAGGAPFGGGVDIGARVLAPALWARQVRSLDTFLITHGDPDHLGGAREMLTDFAPHRLWMGVPVPTHQPTIDVRDAAARLKIPLELRRAGEVDVTGDLRLRVLHPEEPDWERRRVRNDDSVVIEVVYRDVAILFTGDISADVERAILPRLTPARTRILKVAHHGSRTSSSRELLDGWRPQIALISAGRGNTFGHPATEVLQRLKQIGATALRTDTGGQITIETDGHAVDYSTYVGQKSKAKRQR